MADNIGKINLYNIKSEQLFTRDEKSITDTSSSIFNSLMEFVEKEDTSDENLSQDDIITYAKNGESFDKTAERLGFIKGTPEYEEFLDANKNAAKRKWFQVSENVRIPASLADKVNKEELLDENQQKQEIKKYNNIVQEKTKEKHRKREQMQREKTARLDAQYRELGLINYKGKNQKITGRYSDKSTKQFTIIGQCKNGRILAQSSDGQLCIISHDGVVLSNEYLKNPQKYKSADTYNKNRKKTQELNQKANEFYKIADNNSGINSIRKMQKFLNENINHTKIVEFLDSYDALLNRTDKKGNKIYSDSSIIDTVTSEIGASGHSEQKKVLDTLMQLLTSAARKAGVSEHDIKKANDSFQNAYYVEYKSLNGAFRKTNPKDMEKAMNFLRGAIIARTSGTGKVSDSQAIRDIKGIAKEEHNSAVKSYNSARSSEGWAAAAGDNICGWFGCNTREQMYNKLGNNKAFVEALLNAKSEAEFKKIYQYGIKTKNGKTIKGFGIPFDANKIAAKRNATDNYRSAVMCDSTIKIVNSLLKKAYGYSELRNEIKTKFKYDDKTIDQILSSLGVDKDSSETQKRNALKEFLKQTKEGATQSYIELTKGKTLSQMQKDVELITRSAFGTSDIVKDVMQFNENQVVTEIITEAAFEIAGTVALSFVPVLGEMAAARLAVSASRWGMKCIKLTNFALKAEKGFAAAKKIQQGAGMASVGRKAKVINKAAQVGSQMANAGVATAAITVSNGKDAKTVVRKTLMNMSFAGAGATSGILAPKLMQAFGITDSAIASEIAEEIINAAATYGITKIAGDEYGSTDAFIDFATGLIMSRISHVKGGKVNDNVPRDTNGNPIAGGLFNKREGGFLDKILNKFDSRTEFEKAAANRAAAKYSKAIENGLENAIEQGKVDSDIIQTLSFKGSNHSLNDATLGVSISDRLVDALMMDKQGKTFVKTLNPQADVSQISKYVSDGSVCSINGKLYVNDNGTAIPIKMSKEKFEQLFPPLLCASMTQGGGTNICAATSQINGMLETAGGRARLFSMIEETADGGIVVNLANGRKPIRFPEGKPIDLGCKFLDNAPDGIKLIEQAFMANNIVKSSVNNVTDISNISTEALQKQTRIKRPSNETARDIGGTTEIRYNSYNSKTKSLKDDIYENLNDIINQFVPGEDVLIIHWDGHARTIVDYDKVNQIVTYRDPMSPGVDTQCTFVQLMHKGSHSTDGYGSYISLQKRTPINTVSEGLPQGYQKSGTAKIGGDEYPAAINSRGTIMVYHNGDWLDEREIRNAKGYDWRQRLVHNKEADISAPVDNQIFSNQSAGINNVPVKTDGIGFGASTRTISLGNNYKTVAKTAEGNPIAARVDESGRVVILKDGRETPVSLDNVDYERVHETSTDSYLFFKKDSRGQVIFAVSNSPEPPAIITQKESISKSSASEDIPTVIINKTNETKPGISESQDKKSKKRFNI